MGCSLASNADVAKVTSRQLYTAPDQSSVGGGAGTSCTFDIAQAMHLPGDKSEERWNTL